MGFTFRPVLASCAAAATVILLAACGTSSGGGTAPSASTATETAPSGVTQSSTAASTSRATESNPPGDIPDNQAFVAYTPTGAHFSVKVPEGWSRTAAKGSTTFTDKLNSVSIAFSPSQTAPTPSSVKAELGALTASVPNYAPGTVEPVTRKAGTAVLITYQGDSAPNEVTGTVVRDAFERYVFYRNGTRVDLTLAGPVNADNVDPWRLVSDSLAWS